MAHQTDGKTVLFDNRVCLSARLHQEIRDLSARHWPEECCGLLLAARSHPNRIVRVVPARNVADDPRNAFEIDPQTLIDTHRAVRQSEEIVAGCFHSHPNGKVLPSTTDRNRADEHGFLWLIVACDHTGVLKSGMYRAIHQSKIADGEVENIRYFHRCELVEQDG